MSFYNILEALWHLLSTLLTFGTFQRWSWANVGRQEWGSYDKHLVRSSNKPKEEQKINKLVWVFIL